MKPRLVDHPDRADKMESALRRARTLFRAVRSEFIESATVPLPDGKRNMDVMTVREQARILAGMVKKQTAGWRPTCGCPEHRAIPCTVLDPFGGAGTTALVADRLGRDAVLIELNPAYAVMAQKRIQADATLLGTVDLEGAA